ncbi:MAG: prolipoprotein diacylglyceryl transferase [SAR324 cluster bacterium]|nr:prolipoprotein diacylglyceryl transferase [SAR324 cluster bacterium]
MHPYIFTLEIPWLNFTLQPRFYGLFYAISILIGYKIVLSEALRRHLPLDEDEVMNCTLLIFLGGLFGGRIYEVIFEWSNHYAYLPWWEVFAIWHGGLAIHGGILGGILSLYWYCQIKRLRFMEMLDIGALCIILGQAIGRWGNFTNGEAGGPVTDFWTGIVFPPNSVIGRYAQGQAVHPTMLYESLGNFVIFFLLWRLRLKNFRPGMLAAIYLVSYSLLRSSLTSLRTDNQYFELFDTTILAAYAISVVLTIGSGWLIFSKKLWLPDEPPQVAPIQSANVPKKKKSHKRKKS